jgi:hypothetical protein
VDCSPWTSREFLMPPRASIVGNSVFSKSKKTGQPLTGNGIKPEQDYLSFLLWFVLLTFALQAMYVGLIWALAWVALGAITLLIKRGLSIRLLLLIEAPIFFAIVCFSVSTIYLAQQEGTYDIMHSSELTEAMWLAWGGMVCFTIGLIGVLKWFQTDTGTSFHKPITISLKQALWISAVGLFCNEVFTFLAVPTVIWNVIYIFGYCSPIGLFIIFKIYSENNPSWIKTWKFTFWLGALTLWVLHSVTGGIFGSTLLILLLFSSEYTQRSKLVLLGFIIAGIIVAPLLQDAKADYRRKIAEDVSQKEKKLLEVFSDNFKKVFIQGDAGAYRQGIINLADRLCTFDIWSRVKQHMDSHQDFTNGKTLYESLYYNLIPRAAWPTIFNEEKPMSGGSSELAIKYGEMRILEGTSVGVGAISEFYINGGSFFTLVGMLLLGCFGGAILSLGINDRVQPLSLGMCIVSFSSLVRPEVNLSDLLGGIVRLIFLWWVLRTWILYQSSRQENPALKKRRAVGF